MTRVTVFLLAVLFGCARTTTASPPVDACTLETPLVPGVPGSPGNLLASEINPNGASELAALMRTMQRDLGLAREAIARGEAPGPMFERHRKMRCAWPTDPAERNATFDGMAQNYLAQVKALDARPADLREAHHRVISACVACHENACTGPIPAIEALRME
jgi:hypothetical protein